MKQTTFNGLPILQFPTFLRVGLRHAILTRQGGVSPQPFASLNLSRATGDAPQHYHENRRRAYGLFGRSHETLVHAHLVHKADVAHVTCADHGRIVPHVDAIITDDIECGLTMNYADCAPILLYDPQHHALGLGHAGWGGTVHDVPGAMVRAMQTAFGSDPAQLLAAIGPCISAEVYEVGEPVISAVHRAFPRQAAQLLISQPNRPRPHFDLPRANQLNLQQAGVIHIEQSGFCTGQRTDLFFSHRMEKGQTGRFGVVFILEKRP